jgi:hypothetical protein
LHRIIYTSFVLRDIRERKVKQSQEKSSKVKQSQAKSSKVKKNQAKSDTQKHVKSGTKFVCDRHSQCLTLHDFASSFALLLWNVPFFVRIFYNACVSLNALLSEKMALLLTILAIAYTANTYFLFVPREQLKD